MRHNHAARPPAEVQAEPIAEAALPETAPLELAPSARTTIVSPVRADLIFATGGVEVLERIAGRVRPRGAR